MSSLHTPGDPSRLIFAFFWAQVAICALLQIIDVVHYYTEPKSIDKVTLA